MRFHLLCCCIALPMLFLPDNRCEAQNDWYTQDSGVPEGMPRKILRGVHFTSDNHGVVVGDMQIILRTTDGGTHWKWTGGELSYSLTAVHFIDNNVGYAVGERGTLLRTASGGDTWRGVSIPYNVAFTDVSFADTLTGMAVGNRGSSGEVYRTSDGGDHWTRLSISWKPFYAIHLFDAANAIVVGFYEAIFRTSDGGANWLGGSPGLCGRDCFDVNFVDRHTGFIVGAKGMIRRSTDGGLNWDEQQSGTSVKLYGVSFSDSDHGTAVGERGTIVRTTNGGDTWERSISGVTNDLYDVCFTDQYTGTAVGDNATILRTTTGGATWVEDEKPSPSLFRLGQNYPNPVTASTTIPFSLTKPEHVTLGVYDMLGRRVAVLVDEKKGAGSHAVPFNAAGLRAGVYFYVLSSGSRVETRKLLLKNSHAGY